MNKKKETDILKMVYDVDKFERVIKGENPDFKMKHKNHQYLFGVEVTEFYYSESNARLRNIPRYVNEIIKYKKYRHKSDKKIFEVKPITLQSKNKPDRQLEGLLLELPSITQYTQMVIDIIENKNKRIYDYIKNLDHVNLVILDTENRLITIRRSDFYMMFFSSSLKTTLCNTSFREVFFITKLEKDQWVYVPLRMLFIISELSLFDGILRKYYSKLRLHSPKEELLLFAQYMNHIGEKNINVIDIAKEFEVIFSGYGISLDKNKKIVIKDYADYALPENAKKINIESKKLILDDQFIKNSMEFLQHNGFKTNMIFDTHYNI